VIPSAYDPEKKKKTLLGSLKMKNPKEQAHLVSQNALWVFMLGVSIPPKYTTNLVRGFKNNRKSWWNQEHEAIFSINSSYIQNYVSKLPNNVTRFPHFQRILLALPYPGIEILHCSGLNLEPICS
jgi:hypothetical protein